jgi:hypothetical protein
MMKNSTIIISHKSPSYPPGFSTDEASLVAKRTAEVWKINDEGILNYFIRCLS